jgi:GNAT superfamily N-acetyltransferase
MSVAAGGGDWSVASASGLALDVTTRPDSALLDEFFAGYDAAFVLPDEKEDLDGFRACLELGRGDIRRELLETYGPHLEVVIVARERPGGPMIGGANFIAYPVGDRIVAGNLNYVFVKPDARGQGYFRRLVSACEDLMSDLFAPPALKPLTFIELNDPLVLSDDDYRLDSETAGVDQFDRLAIWSRLDARILDFPYIQPPLSPDQDADGGLIYAVLGAAGETSLSAALVLAHLERFFGVSVLKGVDPWRQPVAARQLEALREMADREERVSLLDPSPAIEPGRRLRASGGTRPESFRAFIRRGSA